MTRGRPVGRREFLRRAVAAGLAVPGAGALLAGCVGETGVRMPPASPLARRDRPVDIPLSEANPAIADDLPPESGATLRLLSWPFYIKPSLLDRFAERYGCTLDIQTFSTVDEMVATLRTGAFDTDLTFPTVDVLGPLASSGILQPLNHAYLPNLDNLWGSMQDPFYDRGSRYSAAYFIWTTGIAWRNDLVSVDPRDLTVPYDIFWDSNYRHRIHLLNSTRDTIAMALLRRDYRDVNTGDPAAIDTAVADLLDLIDLASPTFDHTDYRDLFTGKAWVHQSWSGNIGFAHLYAPTPNAIEQLSYWWPPQDRPEVPGLIGNDTMAIPRTSQNPVLAHALIDFLLDPEVAKENSAYEGYQPPQRSLDPGRLVAEGIVAPNLRDTIVREEDFQLGLQVLQLAPEVDSLWQRAYEDVVGASMLG